MPWFWFVVVRAGKFAANTTSSADEFRVEWNYINLDDRPDRRKLAIEEFKKLGINANRFPAVHHENGQLGCVESHIRVLDSRRPSLDWAVGVCEDDIEILASREKLFRVIAEFLKDSRLDVLCLSNHVVGASYRWSDNLRVTRRTQTTACYVVKSRGLKTLLTSFRESSRNLASGGDSERWAIDMNWKRYQVTKLLFAVPEENIARQRASFSNIENRWVDYGT